MVHGIDLLLGIACIAILVLEVGANSADLLLYRMARRDWNGSAPPELGGLASGAGFGGPAGDPVDSILPVTPLDDLHESVDRMLLTLTRFWGSLFDAGQVPDEINYSVSRRSVGGKRKPHFTEYFRLRKRERLA